MDRRTYDTFEHTVDGDDELTVTVDMGDGTVATFHVLPGSRLLLDRSEVEAARTTPVAAAG